MSEPLRATDKREGSRSWKGAIGSHGAAGDVSEPFEPCAALGIGFFGAVGEKMTVDAECFQILEHICTTGLQWDLMMGAQSARLPAFFAPELISLETRLA